MDVSRYISRETAEVRSYLEAETERLLRGRTRDIKLTGALLRLYRENSWPRQRKIVRAWAFWLILFSVVILLISELFFPVSQRLAVPMIGVVVPLLNLGFVVVWLRPRQPWIEYLAAWVLLTGMMAAYGFAGMGAGGPALERYLTAGLFITVIAIMLFSLETACSLVIGVCCLLIYFAFLLRNPAITFSESCGSALCYGMGILSVVVSRHYATIGLKKSFLLTLRDGYRSDALTRANQQLEMLAARDPLTGLANRRSTVEQIGKIWRDRAIRKSGIAFVMADIDHFKKLNDTAGHAAGDDCLTRVARSIEAAVRESQDIVCRHGGEEFLIILNDVTEDLAFTLAERIRGGVEALAIVNPGLDRTSENAGVVTISVGVAFARDEDAEPASAIKSADAALYDAKRSGRNRVFFTLMEDGGGSTAENIERPSNNGLPDIESVSPGEDPLAV